MTHSFARSRHVAATAVLALIVICVSVIACGGLTEGKAAGDDAVKEFHSLLDEGKFAEIYAASDQQMKDAATQEELEKLLNAIHTKLGKVKESTNRGWNVRQFNLTKSINMVQETVFENGKGTEEFGFIVDGKKATLVNYHINSMDLITQ